MRNRYNQVMEEIKVTEEMHDRIIKNVELIDFDTNQRKVINLARYKKYMAIAACLTLLVVGAAVIPDMIKINQTPPVQEGVTGIVEYSTIEKLSDAVGFNVPEINGIPFEVVQVKYIAYGGELAEIDYENKTDTIAFRKSVGKEDNSGDYTSYSNVKDVLINRQTIVLKGNADKYNLAIWEIDGYAYSLQSSAGVSEDDMVKMIGSVQ